MHKYHILVNREVIEVTMEEWSAWMETDKSNRIIKQDKIGDILISTVFLGMDHSFSDIGPPIIFETMVFGGVHSDFQDRYCTIEQAEEGHAKVLAMVMESIKTFQPVDILKSYNDEVAKRVNLNLN